MYKAIILLSLLFFNAVADENNKPDIEMANHAFGATLSGGLGKGILYRYYFGDDYYIQNAGLVGGYKEEDVTNLYLDYSLSVAKYIYSDPVSLFHVRAVLGAEYEYSDESNSETNINDIERISTLASGLGLELGSRKSGGFLMSLDLLYAFKYKDKDNYRFTPSAGVSIMYNW